MSRSLRLSMLCHVTGLLAALSSCQRLTQPPKATKRISGAASSIIISDTIMVERSSNGDQLTVSFDTKEAADCKLGFSLQSAAKTAPQLSTICAGKSATKFSETLSGIPKDQLVIVHLKAWPIKGGESGAPIINVSESVPGGDSQSIVLLMVDGGARRTELTSLQEARPPQDVLNSLKPQKSGACVSGFNQDGALTGGLKATNIESASFRGLFSATLSRVSPTTLAGGFSLLHKQSAEWQLTAKTAGKFGQLRLAKPSFLKNVIFAGTGPLDGIEDGLEDMDPPGLGLLGTSTLVVTWNIDGDSGPSSFVTLSLASAGDFAGITCRANASDGRLVVPSALLAKIPSQRRIWSTLRLDSWQALNQERWLVRVSDWYSMGVQKL